ncbi:sodium:neurotransmitter symporter [Streptomyces sp. CO7]
MRRTAVIAGGLVALLCGIALLHAGVRDVGGGNARAVLPLCMGVVLTVGGLHFLRAGFPR